MSTTKPIKKITRRKDKKEDKEDKPKKSNSRPMKAKKYKPLKRNKRMEYKEFDKKRRWYRFRKIFKNILIATLILYTCKFLANAATNNFLNNCLYNESGGETTSESGSGD